MSEELEKKNMPKATLIKHKKPAAESDASKAEKKKVVVVKKKKKPVAKAVPASDKSKSEGVKPVAKASPVSKPAGNKQQKGDRPIGGSRKGRSQDDIFANKPTAEETAAPAPAKSPDKAAPESKASSGTEKTRPQSDRGENRNDNRQGGYQGRSDNRQGGYQGRSDNRQGGYQGRSDNRQGGYQGRSDNRQGGYQGRSDNRQGGYQGRPGGYQGRPGGTGRPQQGGYQGRPGGTGRPGQGRPGQNRTGGGMPAPGGENKKSAGRKVFKTKKKTDYKKKNDFQQEKDFQIKKKSIQKTNPVPSEIEMMEVITVSDLARKMNLKASELIAKLMGMGMMVTMNQQIDSDTASLLAGEYNCKVKIVSLYDETLIESEKDSEEDLKPRPPIVTVMGHVDHGKTKLLDAIRKTDIVSDEHGGITQHIGASKVDLEQGSIVFLDTPGHEAFTMMRARGAEVTDIVILVVAANDGVMPQTIEAINHAKEAEVPIIIAVNKCDLPEANVDRVKQQLSEYNLIPEDWGGTTLFNEISALKGTGVKELLDTIILQAELLELKANYDCRAEGSVIESRVDQGRGIVSSVIVERGTLKIGDSFVAGIYPGKVRAMFDDKGNKITEAGPATPVEILGFTGIPNAGAPFQVTENEKTARMVGEKRQELEKQGRAENLTKVTLDNLYDSIQEGEIQELKVIIKGDVHGSVEALTTSLKKLSTDEIKLTPIHAAAGAIVENDITLASASNAIIVGFHVRPTAKALVLAEREKVDIRKYNIIYDAVADIKAAMEGMLAPELSEETLGTAEVRDVFKVPKIGLIAGCYVLSGKVRRNENAHVIRDGVIIHSGKISSLKRFKDDAREVESGFECGIGIENYLDVQVGDQFEVYVIKETARNLS
ncbi:MAG: translation initiation factor IF-2 [Spirochaetales bacterium]|uniref:Translation initiation factor IF-2 n=1 Tax=Candidatus Thalassospirochaeta sargassi TaxID=3119039 RepID=A0AAJ1IDM6_9SPIO|nr:translation initiation factor IF-2 [Spirochaetales bacterium]